jgi:hypothetical protein
MRQFFVMTVFFLVSPLLAQTANTPDAIIAHEKCLLEGIPRRQR